MDNYIEAFADIYKKDSKYFSKMIDYKDGGFFVGSDDSRTDRANFFWFDELVKGFSKHLQMTGMTQEDIDDYIEQFQEEIHNPKLTKHLMEEKVFPYSEKVLSQQAQPNKSFNRTRR